MKRLKKNGEVADKFQTGFGEVSVFWTDPNGIQCKARFDYLKEASWTEFKTFDNSRRKPVRQAVNDAIQYNMYYVGAAFYRDAAEAVRTGGLQIIGDAPDAARDMIAKIQIAPKPLENWMIFQEKNGVPNVLARRFRFFNVSIGVKAQHAGASEEAIQRVEESVERRTQIYAKGIYAIDRAKRLFILYSEVYERGEPWQLIECIDDIEDADFHFAFLEREL